MQSNSNSEEERHHQRHPYPESSMIQSDDSDDSEDEFFDAVESVGDMSSSRASSIRSLSRASTGSSGLRGSPVIFTKVLEGSASKQNTNSIVDLNDVSDEENSSAEVVRTEIKKEPSSSDSVTESIMVSNEKKDEEKTHEDPKKKCDEANKTVSVNDTRSNIVPEEEKKEREHVDDIEDEIIKTKYEMVPSRSASTTSTAELTLKTVTTSGSSSNNSTKMSDQNQNQNSSHPVTPTDKTKKIKKKKKLSRGEYLPSSSPPNATESPPDDSTFCGKALTAATNLCAFGAPFCDDTGRSNSLQSLLSQPSMHTSTARVDPHEPPSSYPPPNSTKNSHSRRSSPSNLLIKMRSKSFGSSDGGGSGTKQPKQMHHSHSSRFSLSPQNSFASFSSTGETQTKINSPQPENMRTSNNIIGHQDVRYTLINKETGEVNDIPQKAERQGSENNGFDQDYIHDAENAAKDAVKTQQQKTLPDDETSLATTDKLTKTDKQLTQIKMKSPSILSTKKFKKPSTTSIKKSFKTTLKKIPSQVSTVTNSATNNTKIIQNAIQASIHQKIKSANGANNSHYNHHNNREVRNLPPQQFLPANSVPFKSSSNNNNLRSMKTKLAGGSSNTNNDNNSLKRSIRGGGGGNNNGLSDPMLLIQSLPNVHGSAIWCSAFSPDGKYFATGGEDHIIQIWEVLVNKSDDTVNNNNNNIQDDEFVPNMLGGKHIMGTEVQLFSTKPIQTFTSHSGDIIDLSWSPNSSKGSPYFLLSASVDKTVMLHHISRPDSILTFQHSDLVTSVQFHPLDENYFLSAGFDKKIRLWNIPDIRVSFWCKAPDIITSCRFSPDGNFVVAGLVTGQVYFYSCFLNITTNNNMTTTGASNNNAGTSFMMSNHGTKTTPSTTTTNNGIGAHNGNGLRYYTQIACKNRHGNMSSGKKVTGLAFIRKPKISRMDAINSSRSNESGNSEQQYGFSDFLLVTTNDSRMRLYSMDDFCMRRKYKGLTNTSYMINAHFCESGKFYRLDSMLVII